MSTDIEVIPKGTLTKCDRIAERIRKRQRSMAKEIIEIGQDLIEVKEMLPHGEFGKWIDVEFGWSQKTAERMIAAAHAWGGKIDKLSNLTIDQSALYLLSSDTCPEDATEDALQRAEAGERITHKLAKEIIAEHSADKDDDKPSSNFDPDKAGDRLCDWLRKELKKWPDKDRHEAIHWVRQIIEKEF